MKSEKKVKIQDIQLQKRNFLYYINPVNLKKEVDLMGYSFRIRNIFLLYIFTIAVCVGAGFVFKLENIYYIPLFLAGFMFAPMFFRNNYKNKYELKRFSDVNIYIEQMLYAFKNSQKIATALKDVSILFPKGAMRHAIDEAIEIIATNVDETTDAEELALKTIEKRFPNEQLISTHRFLKKAEEIGGDFSDSIELLLKTRANWENRTYKFQDRRKEKKRQVLLSAISSMFLSAIMLYVLPKDVNIADNTIVEIVNVALIITSFIVYMKADTKLATSLINKKTIRTDKALLRIYESYMTYSPSKALKKSLILSLIPLIIVLLGIYANMWLITIVGAGLFILTLASGTLGHKLATKSLKREVQKAFPNWLMELALLLQAETGNVQVAVRRTIDTAPVVLKPELEKMMNELEKNPSSSAPFLNFYAALELPSVTTTMQMLYSLQAGSGGDAQAQITRIVERNNVILERAEEMSNEDSLAGLYALFLMPVLLGGVVLMVDMTIFLVEYMSVMSTL